MYTAQGSGAYWRFSPGEGGTYGVRKNASPLKKRIEKNYIKIYINTLTVGFNWIKNLQ